MILLSVMVMAACDDHNLPTEERTNSAYYWSTTFENDSTLQQFITEQRVSRIYLRFFDVVVQTDSMVMPNATVRFATPIFSSFAVMASLASSTVSPVNSSLLISRHPFPR